VDIALVGVLGISVSTGSSLGHGRFSEEATSADSAIVDDRGEMCKAVNN
jgi:hypothetical protein